MSASSPLKVLVIGSGALGSSLLNGLAANKQIEVSLLVREASLGDASKADKFDKLRAQGVRLVAGDATEPIDTLATKFAPFHTIVSAVSVPFKPTEPALIEAAKKAGVKRYVPSSFGFDLARIGRGSVLSLIDDKIDIEDQLKASGLDYLIFYSGFFTEYLFSPFFGVDVTTAATGTVTVTAQVSFEATTSHTSLQDVGVIVAAALLDPTLSKQIVRIGSETVTFEQIVKALEKAGLKVERKVTPKGGNRANFDSADFMTGLSARFLDVLSTPDISFSVEKEAWNKKAPALASYHLVTIEDYAKKLTSKPQ